MELLLGFSIATLIAVVSLDTLQQRRQYQKHQEMKTRNGH